MEDYEFDEEIKKQYAENEFRNIYYKYEYEEEYAEPEKDCIELWK